MNQGKVTEILTKYQADESALIAILLDVQESSTTSRRTRSVRSPRPWACPSSTSSAWPRSTGPSA